ncbi:MAG TPA: hypothetical protein VGP93_13920 [Polyangiaceae bacterium]|jgi:histone H3/H4|nr:hypothetical protein [Polyangiaceae bacterium]
MSAAGEKPEPSAEQYRVCSICRKPIAFAARYYRCSVSTCNRSKTALYFCSLACWDAHLPEARHRDAWAEETVAPSREAWQAEQQAAEQAEKESAMNDKTPRERRIVSTGSEPMPREVLVVISKVKAYIRARSGMNTSDAVAEVLSDHLRRLCDLAIDNASVESRKTVLDRDFKPLLKVGP